MKKLFVSLCVGLFAFSVSAQEIGVVFEHLLTDANPPLPILTAQGRTVDSEGAEVGSWQAGERTSDTYFGLKRFDETRLLLGIRQNGINESDPDANLDLAAQYPDNSIIWIDSFNGNPMGIALELGVVPEPQSSAEWNEAWWGSASDAPPFYMSFELDDDRNIYINQGQHIVRYTSDGADGFTGPELAFSFEGDYLGYDFRPGNLSVSGSGADTIITGGNDGVYFVITTQDGNTFSVRETTGRSAWPGFNGASSNIILSPDEFTNYVYNSGYPGASNGWDSTFYRAYKDVGSEDAPWGNDELWSVQGEVTETPTIQTYKPNYVNSIKGLDGLIYVVSCSSSTWQIDNTHGDDNGEIRPCFIAVHDAAFEAEQDGALIAHRAIQAFTTDELRTPSDVVPSSYGGFGQAIEVNQPATAEENAFEILWSGGVFGYGRYTFGDIGETAVNEWSLF
ncbi:MAG: hypothetical protein P9L94_04190 [Candidatus Hinthialibacter antarcticus]|nr:hypothetical protein [Candidatus Hinthialibacter antarcticus]